MESRTKAKLSLTQVNDIVKHAFGSCKILVINEMANGWFNRVYQLSLNKAPREVILKAGPSGETPVLRYEKEIMHTEVEVMTLLEKQPEIPVPRIYYADFSKKIIPHVYFFMEKLRGVNWITLRDKLSPIINNKILEQAGVITRHINQHRGDNFGFWSAHPRFSRWRDACAYMFRLLFTDAQDYHVSLPLEPEEYWEWFESAAPVFDEVTDPVLVHWDLWEGNVFIETNNNKPRITGIIDYERAFWGDPLFEVFWGSEEKVDAYCRGYGTDLLQDRSSRIRRLFYNLYLDLVLICEAVPRHYEDDGIVNWALNHFSKDRELLLSML